MMKDQELLNITDFFVTLIRGKWIFIGVFAAVMVVAVTYLALSEKTYKLTGTISVGKFQNYLLEEGEFVANKLADYSFIAEALKEGGVALDIPVQRLQKLITTEVVNEIKKTEDVGIVKLSVEYKGRQKVYEIYKALADHLVADHQVKLSECTDVFKAMEERFWETEADLAASLKADELVAAERFKNPDPDETLPSFLLLGHTIAEKRAHYQKLIKDIHYLKIEGDSATKSYNTKLAAPPQVPDEPFKPKTLLTLLLAGILATIAGVTATLWFHFYQVQLKPKLEG